MTYGRLRPLAKLEHARMERGGGEAEPRGRCAYWPGSLAVGMRDASCQLCMCNRYNDPKTGQFTQPDPIGLAGGLNNYGFAAGDPVGQLRGLVHQPPPTG